MTRYSGKRPRTRPPSAAALMRRTRSTALLDSVLDVDQHNEKYKKHKQRPEDGGASRKSAALMSLQVHGFPEAAHFLEACSLCKRRLGPGTDIYMYRGDSAFCSAECRHEQIVTDELREKCYLAVTKIEKSSAAANHIQSSAKNQNVQAGTVAAA